MDRKMDRKMAGRVLLSVSSRSITGDLQVIIQCFGIYDPFGCYLLLKIQS